MKLIFYQAIFPSGYRIIIGRISYCMFNDYSYYYGLPGDVDITGSIKYKQVNYHKSYKTIKIRNQILKKRVKEELENGILL
jgi:hypothetical protein